MRINWLAALTAFFICGLTAAQDRGGDCPTGEIPDCNGNCAPKEWVGDGICDDGAYEWNGNPIYFNCDDFGCDGGDCDCDGSDDLGACCVGTECHELTEKHCVSEGGKWFGTGSSCDDVDCDGGGGDPGTCCVNGGCIELTVDECEMVHGTFNDEPCSDVACDPYCPADVTGDGVVDVSDILACIAAWGACP